MVKKLSSDDVAAMSQKACEFHESVGLPGKFSIAYFNEQWRKLMDGQVGHVWAQVIDNRLAQSIGIIVHPDPFTGDSVAAVLFWYVNDKPGCTAGRLFAEMMAWCEENGVSRITCSARLEYKFLEMRNFLVGVGFSAKEVAFTIEAE